MISVRPYPIPLNSLLNGLLPIRISRIWSFGGMRPPVNPSMMKVTLPPALPRDPAISCRYSASSSSLSGSVSINEDELRSEEHTSELQSQSNLVCRLLLEKKKTHQNSEL